MASSPNLMSFFGSPILCGTLMKRTLKGTLTEKTTHILEDRIPIENPATAEFQPLIESV